MFCFKTLALLQARQQTQQATTDSLRFVCLLFKV